VKVLVQRVSRAEVRVAGATVGAIGRGLLVLLGVEHADSEDDAAWYAAKTASLRIFADEGGRMNRSVEEAGGEVLVVSQLRSPHRRGADGGHRSRARPSRPRRSASTSSSSRAWSRAGCARRPERSAR